MTLWFELEGVDFAVTGERERGYVPALDKFVVRRVCVRGAAQNIRAFLSEKGMERIRLAALAMAQHPVPIPYDLLQDPRASDKASAGGAV